MHGFSYAQLFAIKLRVTLMHSRHLLRHNCLIYFATALGSLLAVPVAWGFDNDIAINEPNFKPENFLDYKAYELRKSVSEQWYESANGWRIAGGSLSQDIAFIDSELRLQQKLSEHLTVRFNHREDTYYARKPLQYPLLEIAVRPWQQPFDISLLGSTAFDKRQSELGFAATLGELQGNYVRLASISVDHFYNSKNLFDASYYEKKPHTLSLQAAYRLERWQARLSAEHDKPLRLIMPDTSGAFNYRGNSYELVLDYHITARELAGISLKNWQVDKTLQDATSDRQQDLSHFQIDLYWVQPWQQNAEITLGTRLDDFDNRLRNHLNPNGHYDYEFRTWQVYGIYHKDYSPHAGWGLGLYLGDTAETKDYLSNPTDDKAHREVQSKLRTSWEYHSADQRSRLTFHFTFNLDDLIADPGDGGGMSYQGLF